MMPQGRIEGRPPKIIPSFALKFVAIAVVAVRHADVTAL
jgi:hypothetical protein